MTDPERWERARLGDAAVRLQLTYEAVQSRTGYLVGWTGPIEGALLVWASFKKRRKLLLRAVAAQNLADAFELIARHRGAAYLVEIFELSTGASLKEGLHCTNVGASFSLEPPKGSPFRKSRAAETVL